jgi:hypothetical protein
MTDWASCQPLFDVVISQHILIVRSPHLRVLDPGRRPRAAPREERSTDDHWDQLNQGVNLHKLQSRTS